MTTSLTTTESLLRRILDQDSRTSLRQMRRSHPALRAMSYDHLTVRVARLLERAAPLRK